MGAIRLNLGCGNDLRIGYINSDLYNNKANESFDSSALPYFDNSVDEILAYHLIEHFPYRKALNTLAEWYRALKVGGKLRIETPDLLSSCEVFAAHRNDPDWRRGFVGHFFSEAGDTPGQLHYFLFTESHLTFELNRVGFKSIRRVDPDSSYVVGPPFIDKKLMLNMEAFK